jgi:hypothetical protein
MPRGATGVFTEDANNATVKSAEVRVLRWLRGEFPVPGAVKDARRERRGYDFVASRDTALPAWYRHRGGASVKMDVKCDFHIATTQRVAWEVAVKQPNGTTAPGWGQYDLDIVVVVDAHSGRFWALDARAMTALLASATSADKIGWRWFEMPNASGCVGQGWAVPLAALDARGVILADGELP